MTLSSHPTIIHPTPPFSHHPPPSTFQLYKSGVLDKKGCGTKLDHGVLLVGYGHQPGILPISKGKDYWKVCASLQPSSQQYSSTNSDPSHSLTISCHFPLSRTGQELMGPDLGRGGLRPYGAQQEHVRHRDAAVVPDGRQGRDVHGRGAGVNVSL